MSNVYTMEKDSSTRRLARISCKDEDKELQSLLERNLDLLPGDQIDPEHKLRWLLIKREMPVVNPASGEALWSIDFFLVDQLGIPTLVECKRCNDSRSRREVVGQMFEYAANGRHYWSASDMRSHAQSAARGEAELAKKLIELTGSTDVEAQTFFALVEQHLHESKMRLIFFLEDSPMELRSIVEFLNGQLKDTEILIVEARQYQHEQSRIVVPVLFGFTEEARVAKKESRAETARSAIAQGEAAFWRELETSLSADKLQGLRDFINTINSNPGCGIRWSRSCLVSLLQPLQGQTLFGVRRTGKLEFYFGGWTKRTDITDGVRQQCIQAVEDALRTTFTEQEKRGYPQRSVADWLPHAVQFTAMIDRLTHIVEANVEIPS